MPDKGRLVRQGPPGVQVAGYGNPCAAAYAAGRRNAQQRAEMIQCQVRCSKPALAKERCPLRLFDPILYKERRQCERSIGRQGYLPAAKGGLQSLAQHLAIEGGTPRHYQAGGYDQACLSGAQVPWV